MTMETFKNSNLFRLKGDSDGRVLLFDLPSGEISVGSTAENDIKLAFTGVSRRHARIRIDDRGLVVEDLRSTNGTFINEMRVERAIAGEGSRIAFGPVQLAVEVLEEGAELAIQFEHIADRGLASRTGASPQADTEPLDSCDPDDSMWSLMEEVARLLRAKDPSKVLGHLFEVLDLDGIGLLRWTQRAKLMELESFGRLGAHPSLDEILDLPLQRAKDGDFRACARPRDRFSMVSHHPRHDGGDPATGLLLWGAQACAVPTPLLRALLRLCLWVLPTPTSRQADRQGNEAQLRFPEGYVVGRSAAMKHLYQQMTEISRLRQPVLLHGETGAGKEMLARTLHDSSTSPKAPYVVVNCAAIPENLLEAEMFGVAKGAATGVLQREGYFARAEGGTLFLDEIGELSSILQAKLLRVLQEGEIQPVGGAPRPINVWIIAATHANLESGTLRRDLYYRLAAGLLEVPPLRRCREDIPPLTRHHLRLAAERTGFELRGITSRALDKLRNYPWPGNIRELAHTASRLVAARPAGGIIDLDTLPDGLSRAEPTGEPEDSLLSTTSLELKPRIDAMERRMVREAMIRTAGHRIRAAELLGISRSGLAKKLKRFGLSDSWARS